MRIAEGRKRPREQSRVDEAERERHDRGERPAPGPAWKCKHECGHAGDCKQRTAETVQLTHNAGQERERQRNEMRAAYVGTIATTASISNI